MQATFVQTLRGYAQESPHETVITDAHGSITRAELESRSNRLAHAFLHRGVRPGDLVALLTRNSIEYYETILALWKVGATPQPISDRMPLAERQAIIELGNPSLVLGVEGDAGGRPTLPPGFEPAADVDDSAPPEALGQAWKAVTSGGSTGRPKLIVASSPAVTDAVAGFAPLLGMTMGGTHLVTGPLAHNGPLLMSTCALLSRNQVVVMSRFDPTAMLRLIEKHSVDWSYAVPTMMHRVMRLPDEDRARYDLSSLKMLCHMAAPCPHWLKGAWIDWLGPGRIREVYGGTEAQALTIIDGDEWLKHRGSVGKVRFGEMVVLDEAGQPLPAGEVGEIWMRRDAVGTRTYHYIGSTPKARGDGWESIGDLGWFDEDGYLYLADRLDDTINRGGSKVYPAEVEAVLEAHPAVVSACVIGLPDHEFGDVPHAIVFASDYVSDDDLSAHVRAHLVGYKVPRSFERVDAPLRDDAGKMRRSRLRAERLGARSGERSPAG